MQIVLICEVNDRTKQNPNQRNLSCRRLFWGLEAYFAAIGGVLNAESGYANGNSENQVISKFATAVGTPKRSKVSYDASQINLATLLEYYFRVIDPTFKPSGNDRGVQYRTGIYYTDVRQKPIIDAAMARTAKMATTFVG